MIPSDVLWSSDGKTQLDSFLRPETIVHNELIFGVSQSVTPPLKAGGGVHSFSRRKKFSLNEFVVWVFPFGQNKMPSWTMFYSNGN